jgi:hypothetical protein
MPTQPHAARSWADVASQFRLLRRSDLRDSGISAKVEAARVSAGIWQRPLPGVVASGVLDVWGLLMAAVLQAMPDVAIEASTAAELWLGRTPTGVLQLQVPYGRRLPRCGGVEYRQTRLWKPPEDVDGWPVTGVARTGADTAAGDRSESDRRALVTALVQRKLTTADLIARAAASTPMQVREQVRRLMEELLAGAKSGPEARFWRGQVEARMPLPQLNWPVEVSSGRLWIDGYLAPLSAGYEVQGREVHQDTWLADTERAAKILVECNIPLLHLPAELIERDLGAALRMLDGHWRNRTSDLRVPMPPFVPPPRWQA